MVTRHIDICPCPCALCRTRFSESGNETMARAMPSFEKPEDCANESESRQKKITDPSKLIDKLS